MKKVMRLALIIITVIVLLWWLLSIWVQREGPAMRFEIGGSNADEPSALIVFDPDPFYNLDEQVCRAFAMGLARRRWRVVVMTVAAARDIEIRPYKLLVVCANTYNWAPDRAVSRYLRNKGPLKSKNVVAITLGAGSTDHSQKVLETIIRNRGGRLVGSKSFWLWKPNDQSRLNEPNTQVAVEHAEKWAENIAVTIK